MPGLYMQAKGPDKLRGLGKLGGRGTGGGGGGVFVTNPLNMLQNFFGVEISE